MTHAVVFVHGWNGVPWSEHFIKNVPEWKDSTYLPYSWGIPSGLVGIPGVKHFNESKQRASTNGDYLSRMLNRLNVNSIDLIGHSMGAHIVFEALNQSITAPINNVYLFAGALPRSKSWHRASNQIQGRIFNFSSKHDIVLQMYRAYLSTHSKYNGGTIGLPTKGTSEASKGISTRLAKIHNIDTSDRTLGHSDYDSHLEELITDAHTLPDRRNQETTWQSNFYWTPTPHFHISGTKNVRGAKCEIIQVGLKEYFKNRYAIDINGYPDDNTVKLVKRFQTECGLNNDGKVGPKTWDLLVGKTVRWLSKK